jgi:hypothetical protein
MPFTSIVVIRCSAVSLIAAEGGSGAIKLGSDAVTVVLQELPQLHSQ